MKRLIVGISGASAAIYGIRVLEVLREANKEHVETHLVITSAAKRIILMETDFEVEEVEAMADRVLFIDEGCLTFDGPIKEFASGRPLDIRFRDMSAAEAS